ncbi:MAG: hypothetical protein EXR72_00555 [Myxococcales bacterium]|nr:hypothetical protein [Myxococcales bacterium]
MKSIDAVRLAERFAGAGAAKVLQIASERRASWERIRARLDLPEGRFEKLPLRSLRAAKVRMFRAFKLLGALKGEAEGERAATG